MKQMPLTKGYVAIVDEEDFEFLSQWKWSYNKGYAQRVTNRTPLIPARSIQMHRVITDCPKGMSVDHINGDGLDNRKENLRVCTHRQNLQNRKVGVGFSSKYKGVSWIKASSKWQAKIVVNGRQIHLGLFHCEIAAACMYNAAAKKHFGEFARLNRAG